LGDDFRPYGLLEGNARMTATDIYICGKHDLIGMVGLYQPDLVFSIENPGSTPRSRGAAPRLAAMLGDVSWYDRQLILSGWDVRRVTVLLRPLSIITPPDRIFVSDAIAQLDRMAAPFEPVSIIVNCHVGISRSSALALVLLLRRLGPGSEAECVRRVMKAQPDAAPNHAIVMHGDALLKSGGALINAVERNGVFRYNRVAVRRAQRASLHRALRKRT
jgi:hypothetical protein